MPRLSSNPAAYELLRLVVKGSPEVTFDMAKDAAMPAVYYILDNDPKSNIEGFIVDKLPRLLSQLSRSTTKTRVELQGMVRGKVDWPTTYKSRYGNSVNPTTYVCTEVRNRYDTLENQLLKHWLVKINDCLRLIPGIIRDGDCILLSGGKQFSSISTSARMQRIQTAIRNSLRNVHFNEISLPESITEQHLAKAQSSQLDEYRQIAYLYLVYRRLLFSPQWEDIRRISRHALPVPVMMTGEGERWMYFGAQLLREVIFESRELPIPH
jgi:hypothetical protein